MKKVNSVYQANNGQVFIEVIDITTGKVQNLCWDKYPGELPKTGEIF